MSSACSHPMDSSSPPFILFSPPVDEWWANGQACREKHHYQESPVYGPDRCLDLCMQCTYTYFKSNPSVPRPKGLSFDSYLHEYKYKPTPDQVLTSADLGCTGCRFIYEAVTKSLTPKEQEGGGHLELSKYEKYVLEWHANDSHYCDIELFACPAIDCSSVQLPFGPSGTRCLDPYAPRILTNGITGRGKLGDMNHYLKICTKGHKSCGSGAPQYLPKRLLRVTPIKFWYGKQVPARIRLVEFPDGRKPLRYLCLSHCWGSYRPDCITLKGTIEKNKEDIEWESIPKTFQDVFEVALKLEVSYVWIDSLCIIQDDKQDWEREAAKMAVIYKNAYVTIAATDATNATQGLYPVKFQRWDYVARHLPSFPGWQTRKRLPHWFTEPVHVGTPYTKALDRDRTAYPLLTRAWVLQERLLSPRVIHFTNNEALMECREATMCECMVAVPPDAARNIKIMMEKYNDRLGALHTSSESRIHAPPPSVALVHLSIKWHFVVHLYTSLSLTNLSDRLPAIAGIATEFLRLRRSLLSPENAAGNLAIQTSPGERSVLVTTNPPGNDNTSKGFNLSEQASIADPKEIAPDRYLLGLFSATIAIDLSWHSVCRRDCDGSTDNCIIAGRLPGWWPTWSWISQRGAVNFCAPKLMEVHSSSRMMSERKVVNVGGGTRVTPFVEFVGAGCVDTGVMGPELVRPENTAWGEGWACGGQGWIRLRGWVSVLSWKDLPLPFALGGFGLPWRQPVAGEKPLFGSFMPDTEVAWALAAGRRVEDLVVDKGTPPQQYCRESEETIYAVMLMGHSSIIFSWLILRCIQWGDGTGEEEGRGPIFERLGLASRICSGDLDMVRIKDELESQKLVFLPVPAKNMVFTLI